VLRQSCGPVRKQITKSGQVLVRTERVLGHYVFTPSGGMSGVLTLNRTKKQYELKYGEHVSLNMRRSHTVDQKTRERISAEDRAIYG
jgi:hypothetical protein